jgi:hypothetical protein
MHDNSHISEESLVLMLLRCEAATDGPWKSFVEGRDHQSGSGFIKTTGENIELSGATTADQEFIAHAREDVPKLVADVRRLQRSIDKLKIDSGPA